MNILPRELCRRLRQPQLLAAPRATHPTSAERMDVNSRGCQPTEPRPQSCPTLKGSNNMRPPWASHRPSFQREPRGEPFGPSRAATRLRPVPWVSPTEPRPQSCPTLKGSNNMRPTLGITSPILSTQPPGHIVRPFQGRYHFADGSVGSTHGYSRCSPPVNS
jgi:hypothetical protein